MIVNHEYRFIFLKPKKTAGTSLEIALSRFCSPRDMVGFIVPEDEARRRALGFQGAVNVFKPIWQWSARDFYLWKKTGVPRQILDEHATAAEVKAFLPPETWNTYLKFTILRDPFDQIISQYYWDTRHDDDPPPFRYWLFENPDRLRNNQRIYAIKGVPAVDFVIRYSCMREDLSRLQQILDLPEDPGEIMQSINAKSGIRPSRATADTLFADFPEGRQLVRLLADLDFRTLAAAPDLRQSR